MSHQSRLQQFQRKHAKAHAVLERNLTQRDMAVFVDAYRLFLAYMEYVVALHLAIKADDTALALYHIIRPIVIRAANHAVRSGSAQDAYDLTKFVEANDKYDPSAKHQDAPLMTSKRLGEIVAKQPESYTYTDPATGQQVRVTNHQIRANPLLI